MYDSCRGPVVARRTDVPGVNGETSSSLVGGLGKKKPKLHIKYHFTSLHLNEMKRPNYF